MNLQEARQRLDNELSSYRASLKQHTTILLALKSAEELKRLGPDASPWIAHALTKAMAVDYCRAFNASFDSDLRDGRYPAPDTLSSRPEHTQLCEYRNKVAAHMDEGTQPTRLDIQYVEFKAGGDHALVPMRLEAASGVWVGISDEQDVDRFLGFLTDAVALKQGVLNDKSSRVLQAAIEYASAGGDLADVPGLRPLPISIVDDNFRVPEQFDLHSEVDEVPAALADGGLRMTLRTSSQPDYSVLEHPKVTISETTENGQRRYTFGV